MPLTMLCRSEAKIVTEQRFREFKMPDVGEGLTDAEILKWYVAPGDTVHDGMVVCEVETAKAAVELPIPFDGVVHELLIAEGTAADVGTVIISVDTAPTGTPEPAAPAPATPEPAPARQPVLVGYGVSADSTSRRTRKAAAPTRGGAQALLAERPLAKPPVRKLAKDLGVDLAALVPSAPDGIITRQDVHAAVAAPPAPAPPAPPETPAPAPDRPLTAGEERVPIKGVRRATAQAMVASAFSAPHVTEFVTVDITRTMKLVQKLKQDPDMTGLRVSPLLLVAKALLTAVRRNPEVNAAWDEVNQEIVLKHYVNLGIAAATPRGLIVPNIKAAHTQNLVELATSLAQLVATAREGKTPPAAMSNGTITITNIGVFGIGSGTPILNPGESAILAMGSIKLQPWVHNGRIKPRQVTTLALSFDHRLVDGELGSKVLADTAAFLEHPKRHLIWG